MPTEHTDLLRLLCGSFGTLGLERYVLHRRARPIWWSQSTTPGRQHHSAAVVSKLSSHLSASLLPSLTSAHQAAHKLVRLVTALQDTNSNKGLQVFEQRWSCWREKTAGQGSCAPKCPSKGMSSSPPIPSSPSLQFYLLPQQWQWQIAVRNRIYSISSGHTETWAGSKSSFAWM